VRRLVARCTLHVARLAAGAALVAAPLAAQIPAPEAVLGFVPGTERRLVEWPVLVQYFQRLAATSDRVQIRELGHTTLGAPFIVLVISSPANLARLDELQAINRQLADPRTIRSDAERRQLLDAGRTIVLITSSVHSTEVGGHLSPMQIAHRLATGTDATTRRILDETVVLLVPSLNPDGVTIVSNWYNATLGTPAEGTSPPELYHRYVGHDNNRDWYAFTQVETQLTVDSLHNAWHPQIVHDIHQQGSFGSRFFIPPYLDPVEPNVDPLLVSGFTSLGTHMAWEMAGQGKRGIVVNATYDAWTPARAYQHYHAGVRILTETASAALATSIDVNPERLRGGRNFDAGTASVNFPDPWGGGRWTLADIVDYQASGALSLLRHAAEHRSIWLENFLTVGQRAVRGWDAWPWAFVIPADQDRERVGRMLGILQRGGVEIRAAGAGFAVGERLFPAGAWVVVLRQPYASFAKTLLEVQEYPDLRLFPGGPPRPPYDVTAHTLPLLMGLDVVTAMDSIPVLLSAPAPLPMPHGPPPVRDYARARVGLYRSWTGPMDEGWTRWVFETWDVPYRTVRDADVRRGGLRRRFEAIVIPQMSARAITQGLGDAYPDSLRGGLGEMGVGELRRFVEEGGTLVTLDEASEWAVNAFELPLRNVLAGVPSEDFYAPGSIFRLELDASHPIARGMPASSIAWFENSPTFDVLDSARVRVIGRYPANPDEVLLSGWALGPDRVAGKAALVEARMGRGRVILFGFRPQYRGQTLATFPLLFNAIR